jgi:broad specificity phosphatase PhoE
MILETSRPAPLAAPDGVRLILIRHGETLWNREERWQGHQDIPQSDVGRAQAATLIPRVSKEAITACYASDLSRAAETAQLLRGGATWPIHARSELREVCLGPFERLTTAEILNKMPEAFERRVSSDRNEDIDFALPGMESRRAFIERISSAVQNCVQAHDSGTVLIVAHGGVLRSFFVAAFGLDYASVRQVEIPNCAYNVFEGHRGRWRLVNWADVSHLGDQVTRAS